MCVACNTIRSMGNYMPYVRVCTICGSLSHIPYVWHAAPSYDFQSGFIGDKYFVQGMLEVHTLQH